MSLVEHHPRPKWTLPPLTGTSLPVVPWQDPITERVGAPVRSPYVERFWLPVLGPTGTWLMRHVDLRLEESPDGVLLDLAEVARAVGVPTSTPDKGSMARALHRCVMFGLAQPIGDVLAVRRHVPPLPRKFVDQMPAVHQRAHRTWLSGRPGVPRTG